MRTPTIPLIASCSALALGIPAWAPHAAQGAPAIASPATAAAPGAAGFSGARTALSGVVSPLVKSRASLGRKDPSHVLTAASILFRRTPEQEALGRAVLAELQSPVSPLYRKWLTPADYAARLGAAPSDIARVSAWLASQGLTVLGPSQTGMRLFFTGTVGQVESAFQTEVHEYDVRGQRRFGLARDPSVPSEIAPVVLGLRGVSSLRMPHPGNKSRPPYYLPYPSDAGVDDYLTLAPADWAAIYGVDKLYAQGFTGAGQNIAILGFSDYNDTDILAFRKAFGLDESNMPKRALVPGSGNAFIDFDWWSEGELDLEWSGAVARDATISFVFTGDADAYDIWDALYYAVDQGGFDVISASYADCEQYYSEVDVRFTQMVGDAAAMQGMTFVAATGDWGAAQCDSALEDPAGAKLGYSVAWPASIPSVVGVGGTELDWGAPIPDPVNTPPSSTYWGVSDAGYTARGYIPEMGWNEMAYEIQYADYFWGAGGGGVSVTYPMPSWQVGQVPSGAYRRVPDVAMTAAWAQVGYVVSTSWTSADGDASAPWPQTLYPSGGTSAATPSFAGLVAVVNQATGARRFGNLNPLLYALNATTKGTSSAVFHDITTGNNVVPCQKGTTSCPSSPPYQYGYQAGPGYDMVTGLGSVDANNLAAALSTLAPTSTTLALSPSDTAEGAPVTLTATIATTSSADALSGDVVFYIGDSFGGTPWLSEVATVAVQGTMVTYEGGQAQVTVPLPPGLDGGTPGTVVAFYGGDEHYRASWSTAQGFLVTSPFAAVPASLQVAPRQVVTLGTTGGVAPVAWTVWNDGTCNMTTEVCSQLESTGPSSAAVKIGPRDGTLYIVAIDADGATAFITITAAGAAVDGGPLPVVDSGVVDSGEDTGQGDSAVDSAPNDSGHGEAAAPEAGLPDASSSDAGSSDARTSDAAVTDAASSGRTDGASGKSDSGKGGSSDAASNPSGKDATSKGDAEANGAGGSSGCSCTAAGVPRPRSRMPWGAALLAGLVALKGVRRRRARA